MAVVVSGAFLIGHWPEAGMVMALYALAEALEAQAADRARQAIATGLDAERLPVEELSASGGRGLSGLVEGRPLWLASHRWIQELGLDTPELIERIRQQQRARSVSLLADAQGVLALCSSADPLRSSAARAVERLKHLGLKLVMLSGDNALTAELVGRQAGIERVHSGLLPEQKLELVLALQQEGPTGMVGDGINDAPALAGATVGFAMGAAGSDTAMDTADVVVMDDDPNRLADTILLSRQTWRVLWQNIGLALGIKAAFLLLTLTGSACCVSAGPEPRQPESRQRVPIGIWAHRLTASRQSWAGIP